MYSTDSRGNLVDAPTMGTGGRYRPIDSDATALQFITIDELINVQDLWVFFSSIIWHIIKLTWNSIDGALVIQGLKLNRLTNMSLLDGEPRHCIIYHIMTAVDSIIFVSSVSDRTWNFVGLRQILVAQHNQVTADMELSIPPTSEKWDICLKQRLHYWAWISIYCLLGALVFDLWTTVS